MNLLGRPDRLGPTKRPSGRARGYQQWRSLLFMHWHVSADVLRELVPSSLELDLYQGKAFVGLVPFAMQKVRAAWWPGPFTFNFLETNLRTYVVCNDQPGVYFLSLEAASKLAVWAARTFWGLPYFHADMATTADGDEVRYRTVRRNSGESLEVIYRVGEPLGPSKPDSLEFFLLERYLLFCERRGRLFSGQVHHQPYPAHTARVLSLHDELAGAAGLGKLPSLPDYTHYSPGVDVEVFSLHRTQ